MTEPYNLLDYQRDDGVTDRFRWSRFSGPWFLTAGTLLVLVVIIGSGRPTSAGSARRSAIDVGGHVVGAAVHQARALAR